MPIHNFYIFEESVTLPFEVYIQYNLPNCNFFTYFRALLLYQPVVKDRVQEIGFSSVYLPGISQNWVREPRLTLALNNQRSNLLKFGKKN